MRIADIIAAPIPAAAIDRKPGEVKELDSPPVRACTTAPDEFELRVFAFLLDRGREHGIVKVFRFENLMVDGGLFLDDGRFLAIEIKYRMNWLKACQAGWQFGEFRRRLEADRYRPVGGIVFFEEFSGDWSRRRGTVERGWMNWYDDHIVLPGDETFRIDLVRFRNGRLEDRQAAARVRQQAASE